MACLCFVRMGGKGRTGPGKGRDRSAAAPGIRRRKPSAGARRRDQAAALWPPSDAPNIVLA